MPFFIQMQSWRANERGVSALVLVMFMTVLLIGMAVGVSQLQNTQTIQSHAAGFATSEPAFLQPVPSGKPLGNNHAGSQKDTGDSQNVNGTKVTTGNTAVVVSTMSVFVGAVDIAPYNQYQVAIYTDRNGSPGTLVAKSKSSLLAPNQWNTTMIAGTLQPHTNYWLLYDANGRSSVVNNMAYDPGDNNQGVLFAAPFEQWPQTASQTTTGHWNFSLYASTEPANGLPSATK